MRISILIPLKNESRESIETTLDSIEAFDYSKDFLDVYLIYPANDHVTREGVQKILRDKKYSYDIKIFEIANSRGLKSSDINRVLDKTNGDIIGVYDADDLIDRRQIKKVLDAFSRGYVAVSPKVYRYRRSVLGRLVFIETVLWYDLWIELFRRLGLHTSLSGEGLFIKRDVLMRLGGFPETLAEDAMLSLLLASEDLKYSYIDSFVVELAPKNLRSLIKQRIRWYKGHLEVLYKMFKIKISRKVFFKILSTYMFTTGTMFGVMTPLIFETYSYIRHDERFSARFLIDKLFGYRNNSLNDIFLSPYMIGVYIYLLFNMMIIYLLIRGHRERGWREIMIISFSGLFLLPFYWIIIFSSFVSSIFFRKKIWFKTERR